jgi:hypothetical protein
MVKVDPWIDLRSISHFGVWVSELFFKEIGVGHSDRSLETKVVCLWWSRDMAGDSDGKLRCTWALSSSGSDC